MTKICILRKIFILLNLEEYFTSKLKIIHLISKFINSKIIIFKISNEFSFKVCSKFVGCYIAYSKLIDKMLDVNTNLWVDWTKENLLRNSIFWTMKVPLDCSWIRRSILKLRAIFLPFFRCTNSNKNHIVLWHEPWSANGKILSILIVTNLRYLFVILLSAKLSFYVHSNQVLLP